MDNDKLTFQPRGIGRNWLPCGICKNDNGGNAQPDMAAFVKNKEEGEAVVKMLTSCGVVAKLDYRASEPDWVQVKIGACTKHITFLGHLALICKRDEGITASGIRLAIDLMKSVEGMAP